MERRQEKRKDGRKERKKERWKGGKKERQKEGRKEKEGQKERKKDKRKEENKDTRIKIKNFQKDIRKTNLSGYYIQYIQGLYAQFTFLVQYQERFLTHPFYKE